MDNNNGGSACRGRRLGLPPVSDALEAVGICSIKEYIQRRQATIVVQVAFRPISGSVVGSSSGMTLQALASADIPDLSA